MLSVIVVSTTPLFVFSKSVRIARSNVFVFPFGLFSGHNEFLSQFGPAVFSDLSVFVVLREFVVEALITLNVFHERGDRSFCMCGYVQNKVTTWKCILRYIL